MKINEIVQREPSELELLKIIEEVDARLDALNEQDFNTLTEGWLTKALALGGGGLSGYDIYSKNQAYQKMKKAAGTDPKKLAQAEKFYDTEVKKAVGLAALGAITGGSIGAVKSAGTLVNRAGTGLKNLGKKVWDRMRGNKSKKKPTKKKDKGGVTDLVVSPATGAAIGAIATPGVMNQLAGGADQAVKDHERYGKYRDDIDQTKNKLRNAFGPSGRGY